MKYKTYHFLTRLLNPIIKLYIKRRLKQGKEDPIRLPERFGDASVLRPTGKVIWIHAASVGEAKAGLTLAVKLQSIYPAAYLLITSGTKTSAQFIAQWLPPKAIHQYVPVDSDKAVDKFLAHWNPDAAIWMESELWPNLVIKTRARNIPMFLVNAKLSPTSESKWRKHPDIIYRMLNAFDLIITQSQEYTTAFEKLGAVKVKTRGNIKFASKPLSFNQQSLDQLKSAIGARPLWLAASTHLGEEDAAAHAHQVLMEKYPNLLTIIVPRHPGRGERIAAEIKALGLTSARRSLSEKIDPSVNIYVADTLGELGLFYTLAEVVFMGGSLVPIGGHNLLEAAQLNSCIIHGPYMQTQVDILQKLRLAGALVRITKPEELPAAIIDLFEDVEKRDKLKTSAARVAFAHAHILDDVIGDMKPSLDKVL